MATITIQTRDGSNPKNKPKLYVCMHPGDYAQYFPLVANGIWDTHNAALCYDAEPLSNTFNNDFFNDLYGMRLLIVIVTERFLREPSSARDIVLPFFADHHVPVLPLVWEKVSDALFSQILGDRQYLTPYVQDDTALPYAYKLKRFLQTVLPDDDTVAQIRSAFLGHIFISYRKIDRAKARQLIRTIRDDPACRNTAIWYDEFLTPGEDFNQEIADAIRDCDLFAMAVTENTLAEQNYIIKIEYPFAKEKEKRILPIECSPVDREQLADRFRDIPTCIPYSDAEALSRALSDALLQYDTPENHPQRDYLIGLAYLYGIDTEPDSVLAFSRIATAARAGLTEAHLKLAEIYRNGDGVPVNREAAINVLGTLLLRLQHAHKTSGKPEDAIAYANALSRMAEMLCEQGKYDDALAYAKDARKIANDLTLKKINNNTYDALLAEYALLCSEIHFYRNEQSKGLLYFAETFIYSDWGTDDDDFRRRLVTLGLLLLLHSTTNKSTALSVQMLDIAQTLYDESGSTFDKEQLLKCLLCAIYHQKADQKSQPLLERVLALADTMQLSHLSEEVQLQVAEAYLLGAACAQTDPEYDALIQKALDIVDSHPYSVKARQCACTVYFTKYAYLRKIGQHAQSDLCLEHAVTLARDIAKQTANVNDYESLFTLEYLQYPEHMQNTEAYLQFQLERWEAAHKAHPESKLIRKAYRGRRRVWRWRWLVLPFIAKPSKKTDAE